jgi:hypothetical protein
VVVGVGGWGGGGGQGQQESNLKLPYERQRSNAPKRPENQLYLAIGSCVRIRKMMIPKMSARQVPESSPENINFNLSSELIRGLLSPSLGWKNQRIQEFKCFTDATHYFVVMPML